MQTHLKLVENDLHATVAHQALDGTVEPSVLNDMFSKRLALVTQAQRELRAMEFHVVEVIWSPRPILRIAVDELTSVTPLLDRIQRPRLVGDPTGFDIYGDFLDVTVWVQLAGRKNGVTVMHLEEH